MSNKKKIKPKKKPSDEQQQQLIKLREQVTNLAEENQRGMELLAKFQNKGMRPEMMLNMRLMTLVRHLFPSEEAYLYYELDVQQQLAEAIEGASEGGDLEVKEQGLIVPGQEGE